jgi:hypothetical protein
VLNANFSNISAISWHNTNMDTTGVHNDKCIFLIEMHVKKYSETCLNWTLRKPKTCLNQTNLTVLSTKFLCNLNLCKPNTWLNWTNSTVPKGFGLDRLYCRFIFPIETHVKMCPPTGGHLAFPICRKTCKPGGRLCMNFFFLFFFYK